MWRWLRRALGIPTDAEKVARRAFEMAHPEKPVWTMVAAEEETRVVVGVAYDWGGKPPRYRFFAVSSDLVNVHALVDDEPYQPKNLR